MKKYYFKGCSFTDYQEMQAHKEDYLQLLIDNTENYYKEYVKIIDEKRLFKFVYKVASYEGIKLPNYRLKNIAKNLYNYIMEQKDLGYTL